MIEAATVRPGTALRQLAGALLLAGMGVAWADGDPGILRRATELRAAPASQAPSVAALPAQAPLTRLGGREGPWIEVRTSTGLTGWVHLFDVGSPGAGGGTPTAAGQTATSGLRGLTSLFSRGSGASGGTSVATTTVGIRGLSAEDIANAQPNPAVVAQMQGLRQTETQARAFASSASLTSQDVPPLPKPGSPGTATASTLGGSAP